MIAVNMRRNPAGTWRAIRGSWGISIILGGIALLILMALFWVALGYV
jgi:hypothetical protein